MTLKDATQAPMESTAAIALLILNTPIQRVELGRPAITVGRSDDAMIHVDDPYVSAVQFALYRSAGFYCLTTAGRPTKNPTYINGRVLPESLGVPLMNGCIIRAGKSAWLATSETGADVRLAAHNLQEFFFSALVAYGSIAKAAAHLGIARSTLRDKLGQIEGMELVYDGLHQSRRRKRRDCSPVGVPTLEALIACGAAPPATTGYFRTDATRPSW